MRNRSKKKKKKNIKSIKLQKKNFSRILTRRKLKKGRRNGGSKRTRSQVTSEERALAELQNLQTKQKAIEVAEKKKEEQRKKRINKEANDIFEKLKKGNNLRQLMSDLVSNDEESLTEYRRAISEVVKLKFQEYVIQKELQEIQDKYDKGEISKEKYEREVELLRPLNEIQDSYDFFKALNSEKRQIDAERFYKERNENEETEKLELEELIKESYNNMTIQNILLRLLKDDKNIYSLKDIQKILKKGISFWKDKIDPKIYKELEKDYPIDPNKSEELEKNLENEIKKWFSSRTHNSLAEFHREFDISTLIDEAITLDHIENPNTRKNAEKFWEKVKEYMDEKIINNPNMSLSKKIDEYHKVLVKIQESGKNFGGATLFINDQIKQLIHKYLDVYGIKQMPKRVKL